MKSLIKKFSKLWNFPKWVKDSLINLSRLKDVFLMMTSFHLFPKYTYKFSTRKLLPVKKNRFLNNEKPIIPYKLLNSKCSKISTMEEISIVARGKSFNLNSLKEIDGPIFLASFWVPLKLDENGNVVLEEHEGHVYDSVQELNSVRLRVYYDLINSGNLKEFKKNNLTYVIARKECVEPLKKNGCNVLSVHTYSLDENGKHFPLTDYWETPSYFNLFDDNQCRRIGVVEKVYRPPLLAPYSNWAPTGSILPIICALSHFAKKINVYGWDFYLESSAKNMSYWELFFNMYKYKYDVSRSKNHFESALINFYYAHKLSKLPNINIHGHLGNLEKHEKLINRIERVLFN